MRSPVIRILTLIAAVCAIVFGAFSISDGVREMFGIGSTSKVNALLQASNKSIDEANRLTLEGGPLMQEVLTAVDTEGLATVREQMPAKVEHAAQLLGEAARAYTRASEQLTQAQDLDLNSNLAAYCLAKSEAYREFAKTKASAQSMLQLVLDEQIPDVETLLAKLTPLRAELDAATQAGEQATARAKEIEEQHADLFN